jgi:hypothetical protein
MKKYLVVIALVLILSACSHHAKIVAYNTSTTYPYRSSSTNAVTSSTTVSSSSTAANICNPSGLKISEESQNAAAGTIEVTINIADTSDSSCQLSGYPKLQMYNSSNQMLTTTVVDGNVPGYSNTSATVHMTIGSKAYFVIKYSDVPTGTESSCPVSAYIGVSYEPGNNNLNLSMSIGPCDNGTIDVTSYFPG